MRLQDWIDAMFARPVPVTADGRPRCPKCGRVLLRFQGAWLCSDCRCRIHAAS